jgi:hypothetical protein
MSEEHKGLNVSDRIYRLLLYAYPAPFRRDYGRPMAQLFRDEARDAIHENGPAGLLGLWFFTLFDLIKSTLTEHIWEIFHMPIEKLERWSGLAAALGGALSVFLTLFLSNRNEFVVLAVLSITMFLLWAIALVGLYRRLPAASHPGNKVTFAIVSLSLLLSVIGLLILPLTEFGATMIFFGYFGVGLGIAGMGIIALRYQTLGVWSFVPLLLAIAWVGFIVSFMESYSVESPVQLAFALLVGIGWFLLGVGLWTSARDVPGPAYPA